MAIQLLVGPICNFSAKVRIALGEKDVDFELIEVPYSLTLGQSPKHPLVMAVNPKAETPIFVEDSLHLYDSTVILEYLEDRFPNPALYPRAAAARAQCRLLEARGDELLWPRVAALIATSTQAHGPEATEAMAQMRRYQHELDRELASHDYVHANAFSVADIAQFAHLNLSRQLGVAIGQEYPRLLAWFHRMCARPAITKVKHEVDASFLHLVQAGAPGR